MKKVTLSTLLVLFALPFLSAQNNSIDFDGLNDRISLNGSSGFNSANALTLEAWIYADAWKANSWQGTIIGKDQTNQSGYVFRVGNNGQLSFAVGIGSGWSELVSTPIMKANTWHHIAGVMDNGMLRIYIDGVAAGSQASNPIGNSTNLVLIGESAGFPGRTFDGKIDEVRIWNVARTPAEIANNMTVDLPSSTPNLLAYLKMDNVANNTTPNLASPTNQGILQNFGTGSPLSNGYAVPTLDLGATAIESPDLISIFSNYTKLRASFTNLGNDTIPSFSVAYKLNNGAKITEAVNQQLLPGAVYKHTFSSILPKMDSTTSISLFANLTGDINPTNDSITLTYVKPANTSALEIPLFTREQHNFAGAGQNKLKGVILPDNNVKYSRILMEISVNCPSSGCDPWDQPAKISIIKNGQTHEIARYITPFGIACGPWLIDVTDFKTLLKGYTEFASYIQVWGPSGWLLNAKLIYETNPIANPYQKLTPLWATDNWVYGDPAISYDLPAQTVAVDSNAKRVDLRMTITGHGQGNTNNAAEFSNYTHQVTANGVNITNHNLWNTDCNTNVCANQLGTWLFSRAGWCPGEGVDPFLVDLTNNVPANRNLTVDYVLQNYTNQLRTGYNGASHTEPHYKVHAYLVEKSDVYIDTVDFIDLAAKAITSPTLMNLGATAPTKVMLKNYGSVDIVNPELTLVINGTQTAVEIVPTTIAPGDSLEYTFTTSVAYNPSITYDIVVILNAMDDEAASNDIANVFLDLSVSLNEQNIIADMQLYPNPTKEGFTIKGDVLQGEATIRIFNTRGQIVFQTNTNLNNQYEIKERFQTGLYFVEVELSDTVIKKRVIVN